MILLFSTLESLFQSTQAVFFFSYLCFPMVVLPFAIDYVPQPTIGPFPMPSPTMYWQADAMHLFICGHAPYHHGILSADPVSLPTAGLFNCKRVFFTHLLYNHCVVSHYSTGKHKLPITYINFPALDYIVMFLDYIIFRFTLYWHSNVFLLWLTIHK